MTPEEAKAIGLRWFNAWYHNEPEVIDELVAPDFTRAGRVLGPEGARQMVAGLHTIWADTAINADEVLADGATVIVRFSGTATHVATINHPVVGAVPPSGKRATHQGANVYRIKDGKVAEEISYHDSLGVFLAIGAVQAATPSAAPT